VKNRRFTRRKFIGILMLAAPMAVVADGGLVEPEWLKVKRLKIGNSPKHRFVHFTDLHHKGDRKFTQKVVDKINSLSPEFVCFTGDLVEDSKYLPETLELLGGIKSPMYGVPGNHDYWSGASFSDIAKCFKKTGGAWLLDDSRMVGNSEVNLIGASCLNHSRMPRLTKPGLKNILLLHYPAWAEDMGEQKFDLMLAGHSHGGQVRLPFYGSLIVPFAVGEYDLGLFQLPAGPLYVGAGIGWYPLPIRFNCRPEITLIEI
jgi:predicted MPP superfamily phosphohydrolase